MAIRISEDGVVIYENEPEVDRELFPNIKDTCGCQEQIDEINENLSELQELAETRAAAIYEAASGEIASFSDGADDMPMKSCVVSIEPIQEGTGDPSPENVRPIAGRTGLSVVRTGKNLLDPSLLIDRSTWSIIAVKVKPDTVYTMSTNKPPNNLYLYFNNINAAGGGSDNMVNSTHAVTITSTSDGYVYVSQRQSSEEDSFQNYNYQIEEGSTVTEYETYKGNSYSVNWETEAGTVYGGYVDVVSGKLTVDRAMVDMGTLPWSVTGDRFSAGALNPPALEKSTWDVTNPIAICSQYKYGNINDGSGTDKAIGFYNGSLFARDTTYTTSADFKAAMSGVQLVYELATTTEIQLTPQKVRTLLGVNNIWSDAGSMAVEYPADTKMYIEKLTEPTENDMIADHAISANSFFVVGNTLYRATTAIANGATITDGTNAVKMSLSDALNALA